MNAKDRGKASLLIQGAWRLAVSPVTFVVLSLLWCLDLGLGSLLAYGDDPRFWQKMDAYPFNVWLETVAPQALPRSLWVYALVFLSYLMVVSLFLCTINWFVRRRSRIRGLGEVLVHLGFLLIFAGFVVGSSYGERKQGVRILEGGRTGIEKTGITLEVEELDVEYSAGGWPLDTVSRMNLIVKGKEMSSGEVRLNHPLIWGSTVVYPREAVRRITGAILEVEGRGAVGLDVGETMRLDSGILLTLEGLLQPGQRRPGAIGPGATIGLSKEGTRGRPMAYLSFVPGMTSEADVGGRRVKLLELSDFAYGIFDVHRDPGVWLVIAGAVVLGLGTIWALAGYLGLIGPGPEAEPVR